MSRLMGALRPALFSLDPETAHAAAVRAAGLAAPVLARTPGFRVSDPRLRETVWAVDFPNPVGLAAGYDKWGAAIAGWHALGFGFVEVGTVTPGPQEGNPAPRLFRLPDDDALINRMGFNNDGAPATANRLAAAARGGWLRRVPLGVNIGKHKTTTAELAVRDYTAALDRLWPYASYVVMNVSSPNTPGLRELQGASALAGLLDAVIEMNRDKAVMTGQRPRPVLVKIAPDLTSEQVDAIVDLVRDVGGDGIIACNTTVARAGLRSPASLTGQEGGLSGRPLTGPSMDVLRRVVARAPELPVISVGGIFSADDAWERLAAGARLVQVWTALVYEGPRVAARINRGLLERMEREGVAHVSEIRPRDVRDAAPPGA